MCSPGEIWSDVMNSFLSKLNTVSREWNSNAPISNHTFKWNILVPKMQRMIFKIIKWLLPPMQERSSKEPELRNSYVIRLQHSYTVFKWSAYKEL